MTTLKPRIYLIIEGKKRELDARIYFSLKASLKNYSVVLAAKPKLFDNRKRMQKGIIIFKSIGRGYYKQILEYKKLGFIVGSIDEEGMMYFSDEEYTQRIFKPCLDELDIFFCWGQKDYNAIANKFPEFKEKMFIMGNSRIDILKKPLNKKYLEVAKKIKEAHGSFILINTMFTKVNNYQLIKMKQGYIDALIKDGNDPKSEKVRLAKLYLVFQKENLNSLKMFIAKYSKKNLNKKIIIRPHPGEDSDMWMEFAKNMNNVKVIIDDQSTNSWIIAADKCITSNCTTSLESYMLDKISANYLFYRNEEVEYKIPKLVSYNVHNESELIDFIESKKDLNLDKIFVNNILKKSINNFDDTSCSVENFFKYLNHNEKIKNKLKNSEKDKLSGRFYLIILNIYFYIRFIYRKLFTKQNKIWSKFLTKKFDRINEKEIERTLKLYKDYFNIKEKLVIKEIYPQVFKIEN